MPRFSRSAKTSRVAAVIAVAGAVGLLGTGVGTASAQAARYCSGTQHTTLKVNSVTSCAFARTIARSFERGVSSGRIEPFSDNAVRGRVYSPATGRFYRVRCYRRANIGTTAVWRCSAGRGARVVLTYY